MSCTKFLQNGKCDFFHPVDEFKALKDKYKESRAAGIASGAVTSGGRGRGGGKDSQGRGKGGRGSGKGKSDGLRPPEIESQNQVNPAPKWKANTKKGAKLTTGGEEWRVVEDECRNIAEQLSHHGTAVQRVPNTIEIEDLFGLTKSGVEAAPELCYSLSFAGPPKKGKGKGKKKKKANDPSSASKVDLASLMENLMLSNPEFAQVVELKGLDETNFVDRKYQRPSGYSATTRLHMGRLCVPMLNDTGATCALLPEEQVILIINHTMKMLEEGRIKAGDYNYPIVQFYRYQQVSYMKGAEKDGRMAVEFAVTLRCEFIPEGSAAGPVKEIYFKILKAGTCSVVGGVLGWPIWMRPVPC
jgi:hypothetical protein